MTSGFIHSFNPVITKIGDVQLYYYGLAYAIGFAGIHLWFRFRRKALGWSVHEVYDFSILFSVCVLLGGRLFAVLVYHWEYYHNHLNELFNCWQGGMASHGVLLGGLISILIYSRWRNISFRRLADEIAIPAVLLLALGRIGNFINGQICGTVTSVWWAVQFPNMEGFRHPVTLYEAFKNLMIIPILVIVSRKQKAGQGIIAAHFVFWYGFLRLFTDIYREHGAQFLGIGRNQYFNAMMAVTGLILMYVFSKIPANTSRSLMLASENCNEKRMPSIGGWVRQGAFVMIILFSLVVRSAWTPEVLQQRRASRITNHINFQTKSIVEHKL